MNYVIDPPATPSLAAAGVSVGGAAVAGESACFPVRRIYCVGRNYAAHAREMGHDPDREPPFFFQKNPDALLPGGSKFPYPPASRDVHFEIELVCALGKGGSNISAEDALDHVWGYAVGIDMTRRDLQGAAKKLGRPWEAGKAFEHSAPCSPVHSAGAVGHPHEGRIWLAVNGEARQEGNLDEMIWTVPEIVEQLSALFTLAPGDLVFTGTPAGVGAIGRGDVMTGGVEGVDEIEIEVV